jgi:hypothetical protein
MSSFTILVISAQTFDVPFSSNLDVCGDPCYCGVNPGSDRRVRDHIFDNHVSEPEKRGDDARAIVQVWFCSQPFALRADNGHPFSLCLEVTLASMCGAQPSQFTCKQVMYTLML